MRWAGSLGSLYCSFHKLSISALLRYIQAMGFASVGSGGKNFSYHWQWYYEGMMGPSGGGGEPREWRSEGQACTEFFPRLEKNKPPSSSFLKLRGEEIGF